ncbi:MAG: ACP S-malonyltransferase [Cyanobacteria bacterium SBLK]|nr:ACP S-malonyltransferase [Cyanobacteria bacterium SBLK]
MQFLIDSTLDGYAPILLGSLAKRGWLELLSIRFTTFQEVGLAKDSSDRAVWNYARKHKTIVFTSQQNMQGQDSLEQEMRNDKTQNSLPIITIENLSRLEEYNYRERCLDRLIEIILEIEKYMGVGQVFIP